MSLYNHSVRGWHRPCLRQQGLSKTANISYYYGHSIPTPILLTKVRSYLFADGYVFSDKTGLQYRFLNVLEECSLPWWDILIN